MSIIPQSKLEKEDTIVIYKNDTIALNNLKPELRWCQRKF